MFQLLGDVKNKSQIPFLENAFVKKKLKLQLFRKVGFSIDLFLLNSDQTLPLISFSLTLKDQFEIIQTRKCEMNYLFYAAEETSIIGKKEEEIHQIKLIEINQFGQGLSSKAERL